MASTNSRATETANLRATGLTGLPIIAAGLSDEESEFAVGRDMLLPGYFAISIAAASITISEGLPNQFVHSGV
jgi:hypothetical protein